MDFLGSTSLISHFHTNSNLRAFFRSSRTKTVLFLIPTNVLLLEGENLKKRECEILWKLQKAGVREMPTALQSGFEWKSIVGEPGTGKEKTGPSGA